MLRNPMKTVIVLLCVEKKLQAQEILSTDNIENCVKETRGERREIKKEKQLTEYSVYREREILN